MADEADDVDNRESSETHSASRYDSAYGEGFSDGRKSMAVSVSRILLSKNASPEEIADITGLAISEVEALRFSESEPQPTPPDSLKKNSDGAATDSDGSYTILHENPAYGTTLVEPRFIRLLREVNNMTQARLAEILGVHERTVCAWETSTVPIRMRTATYLQLKTISNSQDETPEDNRQENP